LKFYLLKLRISFSKLANISPSNMSNLLSMEADPPVLNEVLIDGGRPGFLLSEGRGGLLGGGAAPVFKIEIKS
jgi:hypothetical protein